MSIPAGWLATKLGYKGGIIMGLLIVVPRRALVSAGYAHQRDGAKRRAFLPNGAFVAFLAGVCVIATGLTFLETIANPYTTVLGDPHYAATRINLAQSCNGIGWILRPHIGSVFFYSTDSLGHSTGNQTLYIPYVGIAAVVFVLAAVFYFAPVPDIKTEDDYHLGRCDARRLALHLVSSAFCVCRGGAVFLCGRASRHFQLLHQLHDRRISAHTGAWNDCLSKFAAHAGISARLADRLD